MSALDAEDFVIKVLSTDVRVALDYGRLNDAASRLSRMRDQVDRFQVGRRPDSFPARFHVEEEVGVVLTLRARQATAARDDAHSAQGPGIVVR